MIKTYTLENGVRVVMEQMESFRSVAMGVWIAAGSVYEQPQEAGTSHFIEHMLFKGTQKRSAADIAAEMDAVGGNLNAFTAKECTCFYAKVLDEHVGLAADILADLVQNARFEPADIEKEKGVVCEEILMTQDTPEDLVHELLSRVTYEGLPLSAPILGTEESVRGLTREGLKAYMHTYYGSDNMVIAVAGRFEEDKLLVILQEKFAGAVAQPKGEMPKSAFRKDRGFIAAEKDIEQVHITLSLPGFAMDTDGQYVLLALNNILGGSMSSRLFQEIREQRGLAYSVYSYPSTYTETGYFALYAGTGEKQAATVVGLMLEALKRLKADGVDEAEFIRSKEQIKGNFLLGQESTSARANAIGKAALLKGEVRPDETENTMRRIEAVQHADVMDILPHVLDFGRLSAAFVGRMSRQEKEIETLIRNV